MINDYLIEFERNEEKKRMPERALSLYRGREANKNARVFADLVDEITSFLMFDMICFFSFIIRMFNSLC